MTVNGNCKIIKRVHKIKHCEKKIKEMPSFVYQVGFPTQVLCTEGCFDDSV